MQILVFALPTNIYRQVTAGQITKLSIFWKT